MYCSIEWLYRCYCIQLWLFSNTDDGSCIAVLNGYDATAFNYDSLANTDDGSCIAVNGCTDATAFNSFVPMMDHVLQYWMVVQMLPFNYDSLVTLTDGSCIAVMNGCTDTGAFLQTL